MEMRGSRAHGTRRLLAQATLLVLLILTALAIAMVAMILPGAQIDLPLTPIPTGYSIFMH